MASAAFHFDAQASLLKKAMSSGGTTTAALDSTVGVDTVLWTILSTDEDTSTGDWTIASPTATSTVITAPSGRGIAAIVQCKINNGQVQDPRTGLLTEGDTIKTAKVYVAPEVIATGETTESDATYGHAGPINDAIRAIGTGSTLYSSDDTFTFDGPGSGATLKSAGVEQLTLYSGSDTIVVNGPGATTTIQAGEALVVKTTSGTVRIDGNDGVVCGDGTTDVCTISYPSASVGQIQGAQTVFRILNAESSGQVNLRASASNGSVLLDGTTIGMRDYGANYDYIYILNKWTSLPAAGDAISIHGYIFPDLSGNAPNGQLRWYGKQKIWQELTCQDTASTATSKRILDRMARLTSSTAAIKDVLTISSADLPSGDYTARITVDWGVASVTEGASAGGCLMATIERFSSVTTVTTAAADQIIGVQDNGTASIDTVTDTPRIVASSGSIIVRIEVTNTDDVRLWARARDFIIIEH